MKGLRLGLSLTGGAALASNLFARSEAFDNADWVAFGTASKGTANGATDPLGGSTADAIAFGAGAGQLFQLETVLANTTYTVSFYVKRNAGTDQTFRLKGMTNGSTDDYSADKTATSAWQRFSHTFTTGGAGFDAAVAIANGAGAGASNLLLWGAQLETGASATTYVPTA